MVAAPLLRDLCLSAPGFLILFIYAQKDRLFTRNLLCGLNNSHTTRPWMELLNGKLVTDIWLAQQLRPYGITPRTLWAGPAQAKGYFKEDFHDAFRRYIPRAEIDALKAAATKPPTNQSPPTPTTP